MEADRHGFNQGTRFGREGSSRDDFLPRQGDILLHGSMTLHSKCLIVLAGIDALIPARGALATMGIGIACYNHAWLQCLRYVFANRLNDGAHFVTWDDRVQRHGIAPHERIEV